MRIAILTFHRAYNCGAMLQAWALKTVLERMGHTVEFPACNDVGMVGEFKFLCAHLPKDVRGLRWVRAFVKRMIGDLRGQGLPMRVSRYYRKFRKRYLPERYCKPQDLGMLYDCIIVGSDQVFNPKIAGKWLPLFHCESCGDTVRKIVYAASIGDVKLSEAETIKLRMALSRFRAVSFREPYGDYPVMIDPTLLLSADDYRGGIQWRKTSCGKKGYVYMYTCFSTNFEFETAREIAKAMNLELIITPVIGDAIRKREPNVEGRISPDLFLGYIDGAEFVVVGSFHGVVLSLILGRPFICVRNQVDRDGSRISSFLQPLGLADRIVNPSHSIEHMIAVLKAPIPSSAYLRVEKMRKMSKSWLQQALAE